VTVAVERFPVEAGHVMTFARAVGDPNPIYADPEHAIAPPTFAIASAQFDPDYPLRPRPGEEWYGSGRGSGVVKEGVGGLHAEQHFVYHRPIRVGDVLTAHTYPGEPWEKSGRSGRLRFTEQITEFRDQAGELVVTMRAVGVQREAAS
jgi:hypothetical protein